MSTLPPYLKAAVDGELDKFHSRAGRGNNNRPLIALACRLFEVAHANAGYNEQDAEADIWKAGQAKEHANQSIRDTIKSAQRRTAGQAATMPGSRGHAPRTSRPVSTRPAAPVANPIAPKSPPKGYADLADYAVAHGAPLEAFTAADWSDSVLYESTYTDREGKEQTKLEPKGPGTPRRALRFETSAGPRYRLIDGKDGGKYWHRFGTHKGDTKVWYRFDNARVLAQQTGYVVLVNGEASAVAAQHWGIPAFCEAGGGEINTPQHLLDQLLEAIPPGSVTVLIPADCDQRGYTAALAKAEQYRQAGYDASPRNLNLGESEDLANLCERHQADSMSALLQCAELTDLQPAQAAPAAGRPGPIATLSDALESAGYVFQFETESKQYFLNGQRLEDHDEELVKAAVIDQSLGRLSHYDKARAVVGERNKFARIRDRLAGLTWNGQAHIAHLADHLLTRPGDVITYADGAKRRAAEAFLRRWLIGAVGRIFDRQQNLVLVLAGAQDAGKSAFARWLGSILPEAYYEGRFEPEAKDTTLRMIESLVWEIGELDGVTSKHAAAILKLMLTQEEVIARKPYGRHDIRGPVRASFIGTVNDDNEGFLVDPTGNRRYMVISLTGINWDYTQLDVTQVWAEAVAAYLAGERGRPSDEERAWRDRVNAERYEVKGPLFDHINEYFVATGNPANIISNADIHGILAAHKVVRQEPDRLTQMHIAAAFKRLGAKKFLGKVNGRTLRGWVGIQETWASSTRRGTDGPAWNSSYGAIEPDDGNNLINRKVVTEVVTEVVTGHQDAVNDCPVTTVTTFSSKTWKSEERAETTSTDADLPKCLELGSEVVTGGDLPRSDALLQPLKEVVTGYEVVTAHALLARVDAVASTRTGYREMQALIDQLESETERQFLEKRLYPPRLAAAD